MASRQVKLKQAEPGSILYHYTKSEETVPERCAGRGSIPGRR